MDGGQTPEEVYGLADFLQRDDLETWAFYHSAEEIETKEKESTKE